MSILAQILRLEKNQPVITPWESTSLSMGAVTTDPDLSDSTISAWKRRVGQNMEVRAFWLKNGSPSAGSGNYRFTVPGGKFVDQEVIGSTAEAAIVGHGYVANASNQGMLRISVESSSTVGGLASHSATESEWGSVFFDVGTAEVFSFEFSVPIKGWRAHGGF